MFVFGQPNWCPNPRRGCWVLNKTISFSPKIKPIVFHLAAKQAPYAFPAWPTPKSPKINTRSENCSMCTAVQRGEGGFFSLHTRTYLLNFFKFGDLCYFRRGLPLAFCSGLGFSPRHTGVRFKEFFKTVFPNLLGNLSLVERKDHAWSQPEVSVRLQKDPLSVSWSLC